MPRASSKDPVGEDMLYQYKRPFFNQKLRREEAVVSESAEFGGGGLPYHGFGNGRWRVVGCC